MTTAPTLNGQILGEAEHATRALMERLLAPTATTFHQWVVLNGITVVGGALPRAAIVARMTGALKIGPALAEGAINALVATGLVEQSGEMITLTDAGRARYAAIRGPLGEVTARLYADLSADDLAAAARVLTTLTSRANEELAAA
jgi:DNA-binding MarR family transcriptional regulator